VGGGEEGAEVIRLKGVIKTTENQGSKTGAMGGEVGDVGRIFGRRKSGRLRAQERDKIWKKDDERP